MPRKNNDNDKNKNNDRFDEPYFWKYWKRTVLEDLDEIRNIVIDIKLDQARIEAEQMDLEYRLQRLEEMFNNIEIIDIEIDNRSEEE